ncbi:MAG: hypothetical protein ACR2PG_24145 [Hyphomicrobiaceae bacterium]
MIENVLSAVFRVIWRVFSKLALMFWAIARPSFRFLGSVLLLATVIALVADVTRWQIGDYQPLFESLADHIRIVAPATLDGMAEAIGSGLHPIFWDYFLQPIITMPAWLLFGAAALGLIYAAREPKRINVFIN